MRHRGYKVIVFVEGEHTKRRSMYNNVSKLSLHVRDNVASMPAERHENLSRIIGDPMPRFGGTYGDCARNCFVAFVFSWEMSKA